MIEYFFDFIKEIINKNRKRNKLETSEAIILHKNINSFLIDNFDKYLGRLQILLSIREFAYEKNIYTFDPCKMYKNYRNSISHINIYQDIRNRNYELEFQEEKIKLESIDNYLETLTIDEINLIIWLKNYIEDYHKLQEIIYFNFFKIYDENKESLDIENYKDILDYRNMEAALSMIYSGYKESMRLLFVTHYNKYYNLFYKLDKKVSKNKAYKYSSKYKLIDNYKYIKKQYEL